MNDDTTLLRRFAEEGAEAAFTELVRRHVDLVYGAALRRVGGDTHRAADVSQHVFTALAQQAAKLSRHTALPAWLHTATRNAALNLMISENRRKAREVEAVATAAPESNPAAALEWERVRTVLDDAIDALPEADRAVVISRFFEKKPFAEVGAALNISTDAARMRTERGLEKLRGLLGRRGVTSTAVVLEALMTSQPLLAAPAGLATAFASHALAATTGGAATAGTLLILMNAKILTGVALTAAVSLGLGFYLGMERSVSEPLPPPPETAEHVRAFAALRQENLRLKAEVAQLNFANQKLNSALTAHPAPTPPPVTEPGPKTPSIADRQHAISNNLRQISAALDYYTLQNGHPPSSIDDLVGERKLIRRLVSVDGENYSGLILQSGQVWSVTTPGGINVIFNP